MTPLNYCPEWLKPGQVPFYFPVIGRAQVYVLMSRGMIISKTSRLPGNRTGTRMVNVESIRQYIENLPSK
jgi:hypothetical protein